MAVLGPNGAGKSTMIKVLTGETEPSAGTVWRHPNMRVAYVAQHAFHHIDQHLDKTPNEYIRWRYEIGEDRENLSKVNRQVCIPASLLPDPSLCDCSFANATKYVLNIFGSVPFIHINQGVLDHGYSLYVVHQMNWSVQQNNYRAGLYKERITVWLSMSSLAVLWHQVTEEEKLKMQAQHKMEDGTKRVVDKLISRRKMKKTYEYEVQWQNSSPDQNTWIARDKCALFLKA